MLLLIMLQAISGYVTVGYLQIYSSLVVVLQATVGYVTDYWLLCYRLCYGIRHH